MSMLGVTFLNEIVISENILRPEMILNKLRDKIMNTLGQKGKLQEIHDGMDGVIISLDISDNKLLFSGAFNNLFIIRDNELITLTGNRMSVGISRMMQDFTSCELILHKNDLIYLFTDGYPDQFGGEKGTKFKIARFRDLLLDIHHLPLNTQKEILNREFVQWIDNLEQVDDVTILGLKI